MKIATTPPSPTERWNGPYVLNGRTTVVGSPYAWKYDSVRASPDSFDAAYGDAGFVGWSSSMPSSPARS